MKNILIFGSCVSRDVFSNATEKDFHLVDYFARSSFASAFYSQPAQVGAWLEAIPSSFQRNMVSRDFEKTFQNTLAALLPETDILLVDLIDERFDLSRFPDGSLCTVSYELKSSGAALEGNRTIPSMSGEFYALWEQGWRCFVELLQKSGNLGKLRVNKVFWAQNTRTGKDFSPRFSVDHIQRVNMFMHKLYQRMAEDIPADQFFEFPPSLFVGDDFHKWDLNPYHYIHEYYQAVIECLKTPRPEAGQLVVTSDAQSRRSQASVAPQRKIVITVDVEALRGRADDNHIDRLIWGKQGNGEAEYGIGRMMSIADKYGAKLSLFLDYAERWLYGDAFLDVGREIVRRGHDLQLHMHGECFDSNFFASRGLTPHGDIRYWTKECCKHALNYILEAHAEVTAVAPVAYRSGSFLTSIPLTEALAECHIPISANYLPCYNDRHPFLLGLQKYFLWPSGVFELPLSCVENFSGGGYTLHLPAHVTGTPGFTPSRCTPYNFNDPDLLAGSVADCAAKHRRYLDAFYRACGEDAVAVMILHSWSFFDRDQNEHQNLLNEDSMRKFEAVLAELGQDTRFMSMSELALSLPAAPELYSLTHAGIPLVVEEMQITCPICGTPAARFIDFNGGARRMCPACASLERHRTFKSLYDSGVFGKDCLNAKRILHVAPSGPEAGMLSSIPGAEVVPLKISPGPSQNIVMPGIPDESFDAVFCCFSICLLSKQQLPAAIAEIARVLKPGGLLLSCDYYSGGYPKTIQTDGLDAYWKFSVGDQQRHPEEYFSAELSYAVDPVTNTGLYWLKGVRHEKIEKQQKSGRKSVQSSWKILEREHVQVNDGRITAMALPLPDQESPAMHYFYDGAMIVPVHIAGDKARIVSVRNHIPDLAGLLYEIFNSFKVGEISAYKQLLCEDDSDCGLFERAFSKSSEAYYLDIPGSFNEFEDKILSKKLFQEIHNELRRHDREGSPIIFTTVERDSLSFDDLVQAVDFINERYAEKGLDTYDVDWCKRYYPLFKSRGMVARLYVAGRVVSAAIFLFDADAALYLSAAVKQVEGMRNVSYGKILLYKALESLVDKGMRHFNLGGGSYGYKDRFGAKSLPLYNITWKFDRQNVNADAVARALQSGIPINDIERCLGGRLEDLFGHDFFATLGVDFYGRISVEELGLPSTSYRYTASLDAAACRLLDSVPEYFRQYGFADIGCGTGKVLYFVQKYNYAKYLGIELSSRLCAVARQNCELLNLSNVRIANKDASALTSDDLAGIGVYYLYNPFNEVIVEKFVANLLAISREANQKICVCYLNAMHRNVFEDAGFVCHKKFDQGNDWKYDPARIYVYNPQQKVAAIVEQEETSEKNLDHQCIIQKILDTRINKNYLEIGVQKGFCFSAITANYKVGVDPIEPAELVKPLLNDNCLYYAMTSDMFFADSANAGIKFDVIFVDGLHEYEQAYRDIVNSLNCLAPDGVIVVHDCKPTSDVMGLPPRLYDYVSREIKERHNMEWTGDVWKAIVRLRSFHNDLFVFTVDCDYGCAIVTRGNPESMLQYSQDAIKAMDFDDLSNDFVTLLNLKHPRYFDTFLSYPHREIVKNYTLYVEDAASYIKLCSKNFSIDTPLRVQVIENGFILPFKWLPDTSFKGIRGGGGMRCRRQFCRRAFTRYIGQAGSYRLRVSCFAGNGPHKRDCRLWRFFP